MTNLWPGITKLRLPKKEMNRWKGGLKRTGNNIKAMMEGLSMLVVVRGRNLCISKL